MSQSELGRKIFELRQNKGLTQSELAERCNLSLRTVQRIESSKVTPRSYTVRAILSCLDYDFNDSSSGLLKEKSGNDSIETNLFERFFKNVFELFNLKTNTMKKLSVLSLFMILVTAGLFLTKHNLQAQKIEGWFLAGSKPKSYKIGLDKSIYKSGGSSAFLESAENSIEGFGTLMQTCEADEYLGKKVKMTAYIKSENVSDWAGMWLRVDAKNERKSLSFDNMQNRPIKGNNDWTKCVIILNVPEESGTLNFGVLLSGTGKIWFDEIKFEIVDIMVTETTNSFVNKQPKNLDF